MSRSDTRAAFLGKAKKSFGIDAIEMGDKARAMSLNRFSSGSFELDLALGGGWPFSRVVLIHGAESTGKTAESLLAMASLQNYCCHCRQHKTFCKCEGTFEPCMALFVDQEGTLDKEWGEALGVDFSHHLVARPDCAEDAANLITTAIEEDAVDMIVLDSVEHMIPKKEIELAAGEKGMDGRAKLLNSSFRKWVSALNRKGGTGPLLFCINQEREKIGVMYGDPLTLPGGKGQLFAASIRARNLRPEIADDSDSEVVSATSEIRGNVPKNKTATPKLEYAFKLALRNHGSIKKGQVVNAPALFKHGKKLGLLGHEWTTGRMIVDEEATAGLKKIKALSGSASDVPPVMKPEVIKVKTDGDMIEVILADPVLEQILWREVLKRELA